MNSVSRRGACPALDAPMATGDGLLVRLSPSSGALSPGDLDRLGRSALTNGNGIVEITARGSLQFRSFSEMSASEFAKDVHEAGIRVRTGIPVETGPLAGLDPDEIADPRRLADEIGRRITRENLAARLGPKVSVVVDGGGRFRLGMVSADVRLDAVVDMGTVRWRIALASDAVSARCIAVLDEDAAADEAIGLLNGIAKLGLNGRGRDLLQGRHTTLPRRSEQEPQLERKLIGRFLTLVDSRSALPVALPFGQTDAHDLIDLARQALELVIDEFRPAPNRLLLIVVNRESDLRRVLATARKAGLITDPSDPRLSIDACTGAPGCASGHFPTKPVAAAIAAELAGLHLAANASIHVSGCAKGCARPKSAAITLVGGENGVGLVVDGTARDMPSSYTTSDMAAGLVIEHIRMKRDSGSGQYPIVRLPSDRARPAGLTLAAWPVA